jgi:hypothetical protein
MLQIVFLGVFGKLSMSRVHGLGSMMFGLVVQKFLNIENVVTLEGLPFNSSMISFHIWLFKKSIHTLQNNVHMLSLPIL